MARTISYSKSLGGGGLLGFQLGSERSQSRKPDDKYTDRLVKYIPAEAVAFFVPTSLLIGSQNDAALIMVVIAGVVGTFIYLYLQPPKDGAKRPLPHFYVMSCLAFVVWALGTDPEFAKIIRLEGLLAGVIMGVAVFLIPGLDRLFAQWGW